MWAVCWYLDCMRPPVSDHNSISSRLPLWLVARCCPPLLLAELSHFRRCCCFTSGGRQGDLMSFSCFLTSQWPEGALREPRHQDVSYSAARPLMDIKEARKEISVKEEKEEEVGSSVRGDLFQPFLSEDPLSPPPPLPFSIDSILKPDFGQQNTFHKEDRKEAEKSQADADCPPGMVRGPNGQLWPAWVFCTRYSDRPSSGG